VAQESVSVNHLVLQHRRYSPVIGDIKFVLNIEGVAQEFLRQCLGEWLTVGEEYTYIQEGVDLD